MTVVTRFAPSPTGFLHIGGARTALFNYLYARHCGGKFLLRIEDTDKQRSTSDAISAILNGLEWLGIKWDGDVIYQSERSSRHIEVAHDMLRKGKAYRCWCTPEELSNQRMEQKSSGKPPRYDGRCRHKKPEDIPLDVKPVIRIVSPTDGETIVSDRVQGTIRFTNDNLDDFILLRSDGTPTYMLASVVDDYDMAVTHVIRGDDHLTNAARQTLIYMANGWDVPIFAHIPLIHGSDGSKLSKRHGAIGLENYREMGFLPESIRSYLLHLGWYRGNEIISDSQAIELFDIDNIGKSFSKFDISQLNNINRHYLKLSDNSVLLNIITPMLQNKIGKILSNIDCKRLLAGMNGLKESSKTLNELVELSVFYVTEYQLNFTDNSKTILSSGGRDILIDIMPILENITEWNHSNIEQVIRSYISDSGVKFKHVAQPLRIAMTGNTISPPIIEILDIFGKTETLDRISSAIHTGQ